MLPSSNTSSLFGNVDTAIPSAVGVITSMKLTRNSNVQELYQQKRSHLSAEVHSTNQECAHIKILLCIKLTMHYFNTVLYCSHLSSQHHHVCCVSSCEYNQSLSEHVDCSATV